MKFCRLIQKEKQGDSDESGPCFPGFLILTFWGFRAPANPPCLLKPRGAAAVQTPEKTGSAALTPDALQILCGKEKDKAIKAPSRFLRDSSCVERISG